MEILSELNFKALSRSTNVYPAPPENLPDLPVNIDLHTLSENSPESGIHTLQKLIENSLTTGCAGFMLHHQRMNKTSVQFLDYLLDKIKSTPTLQIRDMRDILTDYS